MTPKDKKPFGDVHNNEGQNSLSNNSEDQILLKALQDLIIRVVNPKGMNDINDSLPLGPEAERLIIALQEFVSSIAGRSETKSQTIIEVSLVEDDNVLQGKGNEDKKGASLPAVSSAQSHEVEAENSELERMDSLTSLHPTYQEKLLKALREHVFNKMPIRVLSFEGSGSSLQITLLERGDVYKRLELALREEIRKGDYIFTSSKDLGSTETEENVIKQLLAKHTRYAILSHTWLRTSPEITYSNWNKGLFNPQDPGYQKLVSFCTVAWRDHGLAFGWMDTVCINKESSTELDESIRSMYKWYERAAVCITYLAETSNLSDMHVDPWFTRGWTLQELLAPSFIKFYSNDWRLLLKNSDNDKKDAKITGQIQRATTISKYELAAASRLPIWRKMQLAATREVTREEDVAYSLMGIFNVSISIAYGEGAGRSFFRLLQEILASSSANILDVFNSAGELLVSRPHVSSILPTSPRHYLNSHRLSTILGTPTDPLTITHLGLRMAVILMPVMWFSGPASRYVPIGDYSGTAYISPLGRTVGAPVGTYNLLDKRIDPGGDGYRDRPFERSSGPYQLTLAVFNFFGGAEDDLTSLDRISVIQTDAPVVFDLRKVGVGSNSNNSLYKIPRKQLANHGMKFMTLHL